MPPIVTVIGFATGTANGGVAPVMHPVTPPGTSNPSPVPNICTTLFLAAALSVPFTVLSWLRIAPWPLPPWLNEKIAGAVATICTWNMADVDPPYWIVMVAELKLPIS